LRERPTFPRRGGKTKPVRIAFTPDGRLAYVTEGAGAGVSIVDVAKQVVIDSISVGRRPWGIAPSPDGRRLYTADGRSDQVSVIDTKRRKVIATIKTGERPNDLLYIP
jgi:YVTN family beta-propeller protein